jgi:hypothetical protein
MFKDIAKSIFLATLVALPSGGGFSATSATAFCRRNSVMGEGYPISSPPDFEKHRLAALSP